MYIKIYFKMIPYNNFVMKYGKENLEKFIERNNLPFPLIADEDKRLVTELGAYGEKKMYGKTTMGTFRTTFVTDEEGRVTRIFHPKEIKVKEHASQILG